MICVAGRGGRGSFGSERGSRPDWGAAPSRPAIDTRVITPTLTAPNPSPAASSAVSLSSSAQSSGMCFFLPHHLLPCLFLNDSLFLLELRATKNALRTPHTRY